MSAIAVAQPPLVATLASDMAAVVASPANIDPGLQDKLVSAPEQLYPVILELTPPSPPFSAQPNVDRALEAFDLLALHGQALGTLPLINAAVGLVNRTGIQTLSLDPSVAYIHDDIEVKPAGELDPTRVPPESRLSEAFPSTVNADSVWEAGFTGRGIGVAVLDSGIRADADLTEPFNRLIASVNFAGPTDGQDPDPGGHGTHVAGIIAGNGTRSDGEYLGIAPGANVIDVRVLDGDGNGRLSSLIRGIEWVIAHRLDYNIRVINLSFGAATETSYRQDPLAAAVEIAWNAGIVVVAAAGNGGPSSGTVETPGIDPYIITVGAADDLGTVSASDDALAWFSSWGTPVDSIPRPDVVAPGRRIVSLRADGSYLDETYPDRRVQAANGATYFRLSGTSMATPVVSGAVALLLEAYPGLTPNQVKHVLMNTTQTYGENSTATASDAAADGAGLLDIYAAVRDLPAGTANRGQRPADGLARALYSGLYEQPLGWKDPANPGGDWARLTWDSAAWDNVAWDDVAWDNVAWDNVAWDDATWDNVAWDNVAWDNVAWDSLTLD